MVSIESQEAQYRSEVISAAREMKGTPIFNASLTHATVVVEALFTFAKINVSILSGSLNPKVYGGYEIVSHALGFVRKPHSELNILLEETALELYRYNPFVQILKDFPRVEFRLIPEEKQSRYTYHFVVADSSCYRFEQNRDFPTAVAAFGDEHIGGNLGRAFLALWESGKVVTF